jgi:colicin import membrane protein
MGSFLSYSVAVLVSLALHLGLLAVLFIGWEPETARVMIQPQYIKATLVELAPKKTLQPKAKPKKPKVDIAKQKREAKKLKDQQRQKKLAAEKKARDKKRAKELSEAQRLEALRLAEEQRLRDQQEAERKRLETEFAEAVAAEQAEINAKEDERVANSYRQLIQQRLSENWSRPPSARLGMETLIRIRLVPTGRIVGVTVLTSSGDTAFDRSVEQAALKVEQFIELQGMEPDLFERKFRQVDVAFSPEDLRL